MEFLCGLAGNPQRCAPSIHIAGSKGKGSVTAMLAAILTAAGKRTARYMSPHVTDIRERIACGDEFFNEDIYASAGNELREIVEAKLPAALAAQQNEKTALFDKAAPDGCEPTYFELLTLFFFLCAKHGNCDVIVAETGMGGRLDCTNVLDPLVSVITIIEKEHTEFLGTTIEKIAGEKAGIIKKEKPVVLAKQCEEALKIFYEKAKEKNSPVYYLPDITNVSDIKINTEETLFLISAFSNKNFSQRHRVHRDNKDKKKELKIINSSSPCPLCLCERNFSIPIPGKIQAENAALAIAAVKIAFPDIDEEAIRKGLLDVKIPGRFEKICEKPLFIVDGAHTPASLAQCIETFCSLYGEGGILLFGCAADKDANAMAKTVHGHFEKIIITTPGTFKASNPSDVYGKFCAEANPQKVLLVTNTQEAVKKALELAAENNNCLPVLGTGSFYLVSEIKNSL